MMARVTDGDLELVDTHAHITLTAFDADREAVLARARDAGVRYIVCPAVDVATSASSVAIAYRHRGLGVAVGVHPSDLPADGLTPDDLARIDDLAQADCVVAIGETGLDFSRGRDDEEKQREAFRAQIRLALARRLPVVVHNRNASDAVVEDLEGEGMEDAVLHCFTGEEWLMSRAASHGWYLGIGGIVTYRSARNLVSLLPALPAGRILAETDSPYLAPAPRRDRRNEPANVARPVDALAHARGLTRSEAAELTTANALEAFPRLAARGPLRSR